MNTISHESLVATGATAGPSVGCNGLCAIPKMSLCDSLKHLLCGLMPHFDIFGE